MSEQLIRYVPIFFDTVPYAATILEEANGQVSGQVYIDKMGACTVRACADEATALAQLRTKIEQHQVDNEDFPHPKDPAAYQSFLAEARWQSIVGSLS